MIMWGRSMRSIPLRVRYVWMIMGFITIRMMNRRFSISRFFCSFFSVFSRCIMLSSSNRILWSFLCIINSRFCSIRNYCRSCWNSRYFSWCKCNRGSTCNKSAGWYHTSANKRCCWCCCSCSRNYYGCYCYYCCYNCHCC